VLLSLQGFVVREVTTVETLMNLFVKVVLLTLLSLSLNARPVYFIGDIHADIDALKRILIGLNLVDKDLKWIGGEAELVTLGDHLDRGPNSRPVLDLLMRLETESKQMGGKVTNLIGNHEFITADGHYGYAQGGDTLNYRDFKLGVRGSGYEKAFVGETIYAKWFRQRPAMYVVDDTLFVHGGVTEKMLTYSLIEINELVTGWMKYVQGVGEQPHPSTAWVVHDDGPLWTTRLSYRADTFKRNTENDKRLPVDMLDRLMAHFNVKRIVVGHQPIEDMDKAVHHPFYGSRVVSADTGISISDNKIVSGFKLENGIVTGFHFDRRSQFVLNKVQSQPAQTACQRFY